MKSLCIITTEGTNFELVLLDGETHSEISKDDFNYFVHRGFEFDIIDERKEIK